MSASYVFDIFNNEKIQQSDQKIRFKIKLKYLYALVKYNKTKKKKIETSTLCHKYSFPSTHPAARIYVYLFLSPIQQFYRLLK